MGIITTQTNPTNLHINIEVSDKCLAVCLGDAPPPLYVPIFLPHRSFSKPKNSLQVASWCVKFHLFFFPSFYLEVTQLPQAGHQFLPVCCGGVYSLVTAAKTKVQLAARLNKLLDPCILIFHRIDSISNLTDIPYAMYPIDRGHNYLFFPYPQCWTK